MLNTTTAIMSHTQSQNNEKQINKAKNKRKNKLSGMDNQVKNKIELSKDSYNMMNSNRIIEPFSPTFEHPDDFLPSNQTSFRPLAMAKYGKNLDKHYKKDEHKDLNSNLIPSTIFNETERIRFHDSRGIISHHNRTQSSHADTLDFEKLRQIKEPDVFKETGKFINPLSETSEVTSKQRNASKRLAEAKESINQNKRRPKTGNGRYSRRSKAKNKSEERKDPKRIFSKSVDQSHHGDSSSIYHHDMSIIKKLTKINEEDLFSAEDGKRSLISPHSKINKIIKESLKKKKENETIRIIEQILREEDHLLKKEELEKLNQEVRKTNRKKLDLKKRKKANKKHSISDANQKLKIKAIHQLKNLNSNKDKKLRKKSLVIEFKKIKQEIEDEIRKETKGTKHYKSLFNSINEPISNEQISTQKFKIKRSKNSNSKSKTRRKFEEKDSSLEINKSDNKINIRKFIKDKQKKNKDRETLEKSQEIKKHTKVHENLKVLNAYIKKIRVKPEEPIANKNHDSSILNNDSNKSDRQVTKRSEASNRSKRANNKSRLYEDEQKIFEDIMKHKNNQSLDAKIEQQLPGHLKYSTLLSKDNKLKLDGNHKTSQNASDKQNDLKKNKYYSAPVSTKENGLVTKFKFQDKNKQIQNSKRDEIERMEDSKYSDVDGYEVNKRLTPIESDSRPNTSDKYKRRSQDSSNDHHDLSKYDISLPKNEDIQNIFSNAVNSPLDKVRHISVINSFDNFEEDKKSQEYDDYRRSLRDGNSEGNASQNGPDKSSKAAVPILDFTNLPFDKKLKSKNAFSHEELFDKDSHLDLSSKRIKKLILTSDFSSLLNIREEVIKQKANKEK